MKRKFFGYNFATVCKFEIVRTLKKKSFWIGLLAFPLMLAAIFGVTFWASRNADDTIAELANEKISIGITDENNIISPEIINQVDAKNFKNRDEGIDKVKAGKLDAYFYYPKNLGKTKVEIFAKNAGLIENNKYQSVAQSLLQNSVLNQTSPETVAILSGKVGFDLQTFRDGKSYNPLMEMIAPGIFLVLFYLIIATFGAQMMNAVVEEKENRVSEMILTTIRARTLIIGKIVAFLVLIFIQIAIILGLVVAAYFLLKDQLNLPSFDLSQIPLDPGRIITGFVIFIASLLLFSGLLVAIGAAMPTAKEANQYLGIPLMLIFAPLYLVSMLLSNVTTTAINFLMFFPFTAPIPLMIRNAIGGLDTVDMIMSVAILSVTAIVIFVIAARLFQTGAVEYSKKISLKNLFAKKQHKIV